MRSSILQIDSMSSSVTGRILRSAIALSMARRASRRQSPIRLLAGARLQERHEIVELLRRHARGVRRHRATAAVEDALHDALARETRCDVGEIRSAAAARAGDLMAREAALVDEECRAVLLVRVQTGGDRRGK